jgi:hypothetical protein
MFICEGSGAYFTDREAETQKESPGSSQEDVEILETFETTEVDFTSLGLL